MAVKSDKEFIRSFSMVMGMVGTIAVIAFIIAIVFGWGVDYRPNAEKMLNERRAKPIAKVVPTSAAWVGQRRRESRTWRG